MSMTPRERAFEDRISELEQAADVIIETLELMADTVELLLEKVNAK
jgi:hypothetical protein